MSNRNLQTPLGRAEEVTREFYQIRKDPAQTATEHIGASVQKAVTHGKAFCVKRVLSDHEQREVCECAHKCGEYVPRAEDKYDVFKTDTDDLWHLGIGYPLFFTFQRWMSIMLLLVFFLFCIPIVVQSYLIFYDTLQIEGSDRKDTSLLIFGSYYSILQLRLTYGFDYGTWINRGYWYTQAAMQVFLLLFSTIIIGKIKDKVEDLKRHYPIPQDQTLLLRNVPKLNQIELKAHLNDRWKGLYIKQPLYINFVYDISEFKPMMDHLVKLSLYRIKILQWRDLMKNFGLTTEAFAARDFEPAAQFNLNSFQKLAHPYPDF